MSGFTSADGEFMAQAIRLARLGTYTCHPNPRVGCVLVRDGIVVGSGWHQKAGEAHAEINALADAGADARGATAYVSLEPCSHHGKTPPCAEALIDAGVVEVVAAGADPNPKVGGEGLKKLQQAGIKVRTGLMRVDAEKINEGFISRVSRGRPFVRLKTAASLDGQTAMTSGESQWITGEEARADVQKLRAASGAILTGVKTILADDPSLNVRDSKIDTNGLQPLRVVLDSSLQTPPGARFLSLPGESLVVCVDDLNRASLEAVGATVVMAETENKRVDLDAVLRILASRKVNDVLVEAGPTLAGSFLTAGLVDELVIYQAPHIMGSDTHGMFVTPEWKKLQQRLPLKIVDVRQIGKDIRITARPDH